MARRVIRATSAVSARGHVPRPPVMRPSKIARLRATDSTKPSSRAKAPGSMQAPDPPRQSPHVAAGNCPGRTCHQRGWVSTPLCLLLTSREESVCWNPASLCEQHIAVSATGSALLLLVARRVEGHNPVVHIKDQTPKVGLLVAQPCETCSRVV
jgi:hypothetical protein